MDHLDLYLREMLSFDNWKINIIFGKIKYYKYYFWNGKEIREINEEYHAALEEENFCSIPYVDFFRKKDEVLIGHSFISDPRDSCYYIVNVIKTISYNLEMLNTIVDWGYHSLKRDNWKTYSETVDEFVRAQRYKEKPSDGDTRLLPSTEVKRRTVWGDRIIEEAFKDLEAAYDDKSTLEEVTDDKESPISIQRHTLQFKEVGEFNLSEDSKRILKNGLKGINEIDLETAINLVENYKYYVEPKNYQRFYRCLKKNIFSIYFFDSVAIGSLIYPIQRYYPSYFPFHLGAIEVRDAAIKVKREVDELIDAVGKEVERLFFLIDILGYFQKKGYDYLGSFGFTYRDINAVMRSCVILDKLPLTWYCFDPKVMGKWLEDDVEATELGRERARIALIWILKGQLMIDNSLITLAFEIAMKENQLSVAMKEVDKGIRRFKRQLKRGELVF